MALPEQVPIDANSQPLPLVYLTQLDIALSKAALAANVAQKNAGGNYGINGYWGSAGTAIQPGTGEAENTILNVSGFGKLTFIRFMSTHSNYPEIYIKADEVGICNAQYAPTLLWQRYEATGQFGQEGWIHLARYDTTNNKYVLVFTPWVLGAFGSSIKVYLGNSDTVEHPANVAINYFVAASQKYQVTPADVNRDPAEVRAEISDLLRLDMDELVVAIYWEWDEQLAVNVGKLDVYIHPDLSSPQIAELQNYLDAL